MNTSKKKTFKKSIRHARVRAKVEGNAERPRLSVFRSGKHIYAQVIDDAAGKTLATVSDLSLKEGQKTAKAADVGRLIAEMAKKAGVNKVSFDRGGYKYHGRVKALAEAAREAGLEF